MSFTLIYASSVDLTALFQAKYFVLRHSSSILGLNSLSFVHLDEKSSRLGQPRMRSAAADLLLPVDASAVEQLWCSGSRVNTITLPGLGTNVVADAMGEPSDWVADQLSEASALPQSERDMLHQNVAGLLLYCDSDDFGRCFVPQHARKSLVLMAHRRLMHLQHGDLT